MSLSRLERSLLMASRGPFLSPDGDGGGGGGDNANSGGEQGDGKGDEGKVEFSPEQQRHIDKLIGDARKDGAKSAAEKARAAQEEAAKKAEEEAAAERGEFENIAKKRESERDSARTEAAALKAENDQYREAVSLVIAVEWDALPEEVRDAYLGDDDDALSKLAFLPKGKALAAKLGEKAEAMRGNGYDPKSRGDGKKSNDEAARKAQAVMYRNL